LCLIPNACDNRYCGLQGVRGPQPSCAPGHKGLQHSFWLGETLKYAWLIFDDGSTLPLTDWVFTTEAHPLPVDRSHPHVLLSGDLTLPERSMSQPVSRHHLPQGIPPGDPTTSGPLQSHIRARFDSVTSTRDGEKTLRADGATHNARLWFKALVVIVMAVASCCVLSSRLLSGRRFRARGIRTLLVSTAIVVVVVVVMFS
jgi:hypothetical protein